MSSISGYLFLVFVLAAHVQCNEHATALPSHLVTQTVYGFLDFTTTIGNTIMVFSPQSSPAPEPSKVISSAERPSTSLIEIKPPSTFSSDSPKTDIKPTKPVSKSTKQLSSVVRVVSAANPSPSIVNTSSKSLSSKVQIVSSHAEVIDENKSAAAHKSVVQVKAIGGNGDSHHPTTISASRIDVVAGISPIQSSLVEVHTSEDLDQILPVENNINDPEYEFLSREPSEFAEETYRIPPSNKLPNSKYSLKPRPSQEHKKLHPSQVATPRSDDIHPTGLVTKLGGTVVKDGVTTIHETSVLGTYISGKYAQVLQSTSHIYNANGVANKQKIAPTHSLRVLKTAAPHIPKKSHIVESTSGVKQAAAVESEEIEEIFGNSQKQNLVRNQRRPAITSNNFKNRFRTTNNRQKEEAEYVDLSSSSSVESITPAVNTPAYKKPRTANKSPKRPISSSVEVTTVSAVFSEPSASTAYASRRNKSNRFKPQNVQLKEVTVQQAQQTTIDNAFNRRFKPKIQPSNTEQSDSSTSSLYKFKLNRQPGRWQYKTSPKPRVTIRKQNSDDLHPNIETATSVHESFPAAPIPSNADDANDGHTHGDLQIVSASSPADSRSDSETDLDSSGSINGDVLDDADTFDNSIQVSKKLPVETLKVEISTPADFKDTYYEIATIKSPYTYQVGTARNTRYVTVTSTFEKTLDPEPTATSSFSGPLTENILATTAHYDRDNNLLDASVATLPPLILASDVETPPLETLTETFSTTQTMLKTHILPVLHEGGGNATSYTLTQTYMITRLVTATKTLPPIDAYHFNPTKALKEFNSKLDEAGSELNLELDFGDDNEHEDSEDAVRQALPDDLDLANIGSSFDLSEVDKSNIPEGHLRPKKKNTNKAPTEPTIVQNDRQQLQQLQQQHQQQQHQQQLQQHQQQLQLQQHQLHQQQQQQQFDTLSQPLSPDQLQQLALLRLLNPAAAAQFPNVITTSKPIIKLETVYESHKIPIFNGISTVFSTISRPIATVSKTEYETGTSTLPQFPIPQPPINPLFQQPQQFQITTAPIVTQTMITETRSKVLKLTFGAKTAYTTLFSTNVVPTILTTYVTQSLPIQQTAAYPGYYPAPYAINPYVG